MLLFLIEDNPPALKPRDFGEPLEHRVRAEGAEGAVAAAQPHQWNQLLLFSFILVFFFYPPVGHPMPSFLQRRLLAQRQVPAHGSMVGSQKFQGAEHC